MAQVIAQPDIDTLFEAGAHFGRSKSRRHPTAAPYIFGSKDNNDIFDLTQTATLLTKALEAVTKIAGEGKQILFVGGKAEVANIVKGAAERVGAPLVAGRWIGGTLTNFKQIRRRIDRLNKLTGEKERHELDKYTKRERLLIDREIEELEHRFRGLVDMNERPGMIFVVDTRHEHTAVKEAIQMGIPVIGLANSDCDMKGIAYPIPANDSSARSVAFFVNTIADAYWAYKKAAPAAAPKRGKAE
ncbi:30S ribosomal protein S2 [Candidatus Kaiserbacteria bacterium]|nr:30S ribosomal protein S2 [Candidatus Kaiserbacteria bacterium]